METNASSDQRQFINYDGRPHALIIPSNDGATGPKLLKSLWWKFRKCLSGSKDIPKAEIDL